MGRTKAIAHFVAVSDLSKPAQEQEGILIEIEARGGDTPSNRTKALEQLEQMWENGEIDADLFPDGIGQENIFFVPPGTQQSAPEATAADTSELLPVVQGAREIVELTKLQIEVQEAAEEAAPYTPIIEAVLDRTRPLTAEEKDLAKEKKYGKVIERIGYAIASQAEYQDNCTGNGKLILNAIAWQLSNKTDNEEE
ncbi:hypothetical protein [Oscillatoria sp. FACHB-1406]|uniref:hypothetical protein n=1 Tax=Oscillatoria sp. FACHB-1406 TaxID=2692846 RepID=UPI00168795C7|nr:hypothetical protein [Oscillatoria sp. FACHB-1406]MBD2578509.1 hypothetical protein [Oscillatoria sp. FACHB-1406]